MSINMSLFSRKRASPVAATTTVTATDKLALAGAEHACCKNEDAPAKSGGAAALAARTQRKPESPICCGGKHSQ